MNPIPRKRGGQPGNKNALKHGFYSQSFTTSEARDLESVINLDLTDEIAMMRISLRRVFEVIHTTEDPEDGIAALGALGQASTRLASLMKAQRFLAGTGSTDIASALSQALSDVVKEFNHDNVSHPEAN